MAIDWESYRWIPEKLSQKFRPNRVVNLDDLYVVGLTALWKATQTYDETKGATFETYAYHRVKGAMQHELRDTSGVPSWAYERGVRLYTVGFPDVDEEKLECMIDGADTEGEALDRVEGEVLWEAVRRLDTPRREAITERIITERSFAKIGEDQGVCGMSVYHRMQSGLTRVRRDLAARRWKPSEN